MLQLQLAQQQKGTKMGIVKKSMIAMALVGLMATGAGASTVAFDVTPGGGYGTSAATLGYEFTVNAAVKVTDLGVYDGGGNGFAGSIEVGIWDSVGTLLASTTLASGTVEALTDGFRYKSIAALLLTTGTYRIGAALGAFEIYTQFAGITNNTSLVSHGTSYVTSGSGLNRPTTTFGDAGAYFGPNMMIAAVPLPAALPLLLAALGGLGFVASRRKAA
jgi:hypothetical protein